MVRRSWRWLLTIGFVLAPPGHLAVAAHRGGGQAWMADRTLMTRLRETGDVVERPHAKLWFDHDALPPAARDQFADLVERGITAIAAWLGVPAGGRRKFCYVISGEVDISHSRSGCVFLPLARVRRRSAPYLHETTHLLAPCDQCPVWFSEGFASYLQSEIAARGGGYDGAIFTNHGNQGVDRDARQWLRTPEGQAVIGFIGVDAEPPEMSWNREAVAAPFYVLAQSFVKFLALHVGHDGLRRLATATAFATAVRPVTGASVATWKRRWLTALVDGKPGRAMP